MKRKFSFNLAPVKIVSSRTETKPTAEPTPAANNALPPHRRQQSKDSIVTLNSPFISRRPLSPKTEQELRAACKLVLQNFKPSDHGLDDDMPTLVHSTMSQRRVDSSANKVRVHRPTGAPPEGSGSHNARRAARKPDASAKEYPDPPMRANTGRRRADQTENEARRHAKSVMNEHSKLAAARTDMDADDTTSVKTPMTCSTDAHANGGSTAPTSAALTSSYSSKRESRHFDSAAAAADTQAAEWMRQELEKRRQKFGDLTQEVSKGPSRPPTRSKSIRAGIKDYIFPGSSTLSRTQSHETLSSRTSAQSMEPKRSGSSHGSVNGWRSWGLQRKSSSRSSSRPGTSKGRIESQDQDSSSKRAELNLNRELPPLPSLDSWKKPAEKARKEKPLSPTSPTTNGTHIASLMRPQDSKQQDYAAAARRSHRKSGSDTLAMRYAKSPYATQQAQAHHITQAAVVRPHLVSTKRSEPTLDMTMDFDQMMSVMDSSTRDLDDHLKLHLNTHTRGKSSGSVSRAPSLKYSLDQGARGLEVPPNFSRKISTEVPRSIRENQELTYPNIVQLGPISGNAVGNGRANANGAAIKEGEKEVAKGRLRKVFSGWMLRREKKENWMDKVEREGVREGVMIQDEAALPPVVRY
ncbi:hypothetical protein P154DRAFT_521662 [Amniculicola lignicola CBS 123094]|uniref:Uncharacterized protein n=1 Tax=Amniculicola lignicola CBS 123094 TaxID=1392246 RepID=A0A6A5WIW5_9PLEO|nr:hypothetical protein P154DRAFT_521662 [Amniculicola lignicola CBS 123094]